MVMAVDRRACSQAHCLLGAATHGRAGRQRAPRRVTIGTVGTGLGQSLAGLHRAQARVLRRRGPQARHRLRAIERAAGAADHRRLARHLPYRPAWSIRSARSSMGAPIAIVRVEVQAPPYALIAKPAIKSLADLKGKVISLGGPKDITRIYVERMLAPNGVKPGEFDMVFAGATAARASALLAGAVDAAILLPPFNFQAETAGFNNLGLTIDYTPGSAVLRHRGERALGRRAQGAARTKLLAAHIKSMAWFEDEQQSRPRRCRSWWRPASSSRRTSTKAYDFMRKGAILRAAPARSRRSKLTSLAEGDGEPRRRLAGARHRAALASRRDAGGRLGAARARVKTMRRLRFADVCDGRLGV